MKNLDSKKLYEYGLIAEFAYVKLESDYYTFISKNDNAKNKIIYSNENIKKYFEASAKKIETDLNTDLAITKYIPFTSDDEYDYKGTSNKQRQDELLTLLNKYEVLEFTSSSNDFQAMLLQENSNKQYVIAFRGTAGFMDIAVDAGISGATNAQENAAMNFVNEMSVKYQTHKEDFILTGHSLGGILVETVGSRFSIPGFAYNPLGSSRLITGNHTSWTELYNVIQNLQEKKKWASKNIYSVSYNDDGFLNGDVLSNLATKLAGASHMGMTINVFGKNVGLGAGHSIITLNKVLKDSLEQKLVYIKDDNTLELTAKNLQSNRTDLSKLIDLDTQNTLLKHDITIKTISDNKQYTVMKKALIYTTPISQDNFL